MAISYFKGLYCHFLGDVGRTVRVSIVRAFEPSMDFDKGSTNV